jgi:hypothetical protein
METSAWFAVGSMSFCFAAAAASWKMSCLFMGMAALLIAMSVTMAQNERNER